MLRKVTRIFLRTLVIFCLVLFVLLGVLFFGLQSTTFQTWLGRKATSYLSTELKSEVSIKAISLEFFTKVHLRGVMIRDHHRDTLLQGDLLVNLRRINWRKQKVSIKTIRLENTTAKLIKYKNEKDFNFQFLVDYFDSGSSDTTTTNDWEVGFGDVELRNVAFIYRNERYVEAPSKFINYDDMDVRHISGDIRGLKFDGDTIYGRVSSLSAIEKSGFKLAKLNALAKVSSRELLCDDLLIRTPHSRIQGKLHFHYQHWEDYQDFVSKVDLDSRLDDSTKVSFKDIVPFAPELDGLEETVSISGRVKGPVKDLNLSNFNLAYGNHTRFRGQINLSGIPELNEMYLHLDAKELSTDYLDLIQVPAYPFNEGKNLEIPARFRELGTVTYAGKLDGFVNDFSLYGKFKSGIGQVTTKISLKLADKNDDIAYHGSITSDNFNLGTLLGVNDFNALTMNFSLDGKGIDIKKLKASFDGAVQNLQFSNYDYKNIQLNGNISDGLFEGMLVSNDTNANFDFNGTIDFKNKIPEMDFISTINRVDLSALHLVNRPDSGILSSQLFIKLNGDNIDNLTGQVNLDNTIYKTKKKQYKLSTFNILLDQSGPEKKVRLNSEYLNAMAYGRYNPSELKLDFDALLYNYYPSLFKKPESPRKTTNQLTFQAKIKKFNTINALFLPDAMVANGSTIDGNFNAAENQLNLQVSSPKISYKNFQASDFVFILNENSNTVIAEASGKVLRISDSLNLENFNLAVQSKDTALSYTFDWDNLKTPLNKGEFKGSVAFGDSALTVYNEKIAVTLNDSTWSLLKPSKMTIYKNGALQVEQTEIARNEQKISVAGSLSKNVGDSLLVGVNRLILQQFNPLLKIVNLKLEGMMDGDVVLSNSDANLTFKGDLKASQLKINDNAIGQVLVTAKYHTQEKFISLQGFTSLGVVDEFGEQAKNISFKGRYDLTKKEESIDIDFAAKPANLRLLNPFLEGILTINSGFVNGGGKVHGNPSNIKIDGKFRLFNSEIKVDYTNVVYNMTGDIEIFPDQIRFSDMNIREKGTKTQQGTLNGNLFHDNFSKIRIDFDVNYKNMLVLNTNERLNSSFYGKVYGTGNVGIWGYLNNLAMSIETTPNKNSRFFLPLDGPAEINESDFIQFVKKDTIGLKKEKAISGFNLDMKLHATPDALVQIIIDKTSGDVLNVQGQGDLNLSVNTLGKFEMFGDYVITDGDYLFTLENVINKKFDIDAGSSISWSGNPLGAEIDVTTSYKQRASVAPLLNDTSGAYKSRTPIECKLLITGKLFSPEIRFNVDFPSIDATARARIESVLSDEAELNRQVFAFLLFRTFLTPLIYNSNTGGVTAGNAASSTGSELLSNRVSEFLNTYFGTLTGIRDLQLGLNYRPGSQNSNETVDLALSKQFLDNRMSVEGNFGVNNSPTRNNSNSFIGDVNVEYKLSQDGRFRLKGFNKSNDNSQVALAGGAYTQGVGFFYRVEFDNFGDLYRRYLDKVKRKSDKADKKSKPGDPKE